MITIYINNNKIIIKNTGYNKKSNNKIYTFYNIYIILYTG